MALSEPRLLNCSLPPLDKLLRPSRTPTTPFPLRLTYNYGKDSYDIGEGFGHFAIATNDVYKLSEDIKKAGGNITREPGPVKGGTTHIAFAKDPTGYQFELIQREGKIPEPLAQVMALAVVVGGFLHIFYCLVLVLSWRWILKLRAYIPPPPDHAACRGPGQEHRLLHPGPGPEADQEAG